MIKKKITRVVFEYEDTAQYLTGKEAEKWMDTVNGMCVLAQNRGQNPFQSKEFNWVTIKERDIPTGAKEYLKSKGFPADTMPDIVRVMETYMEDHASQGASTLPTEEEIENHAKELWDNHLEGYLQIGMTGTDEEGLFGDILESMRSLLKDRLGSATSSGEMCKKDSCKHPEACRTQGKCLEFEPPTEVNDGWISVEDEHPEHESGSTGFIKCLGYLNNGAIKEVEYNMRTEKFQNTDSIPLENYITHWQPLPESPITES